MKKKYHKFRFKNRSTIHKLCTLILFGVLANFHSQAQIYATVPFSDGFETGTLGPSWTTSSTLATGGIAPIQTGTLTWSTQTAVSYSGNYFLGMHYPTGGSFNLNQCNLHLNLAGESDVRLSFWWAEWNDESHVEDGVFISDDNGATFTKVIDLAGAAYADLVYTYFDLSLDSINTVHGLNFSSQYIVRFQQYDNFYFAGGNDGHLYDDVAVYQVCSSSSSIIESVCSSYTTPSGSQTYTTSGIYTDTIPNAAGCDSIITIDLSVNNTALTISEQSCGSYTAPDGSTYTSSGMYTATLPNSAGCDSLITIDLQILQPTTSTITESVCDTYTSPDGMTYTTTGMYTAVIPNAAGCDSTITIDLTINQTTTTNISEGICMGSDYTAPDGAVYDSAGVYTAVVPSSAGCDSIIVIDLAVNDTTSSTITESVLDTYTVPSGDETYTVSGMYMDTIPNANGCDSVITINLTVEYTGLDELNSSVLSVYPNPTSGNVTINGLDNINEVEQMELIDNRGRLVMTLPKNTDFVHLDGVEAGVYILLVIHDKGIERLPIVKK